MRTLSSDLVERRQRHWKFVLENSDVEPWHREHLTRLFEGYDQANDAYYDGVLVPPLVLLTGPSSTRTLGDWCPTACFGELGQIRIRPSLLTGTHPRLRPGPEFAEGRARYVADVLLHEQIHQYHQEVTGLNEEPYHGHGPAFRDKANEIGAKLGLPPVLTSKKRGPDRDLPSCAQWPHNVRPDDYYLGAYIPPDVPTTRDEPPMITVPITVEGVLMVIDRLPEDEQAVWLSRRTA